MAAPEKAVWYGLLCSVGSLLGGIAGYAIGLYGGRPLLYKFFRENKIHAVEKRVAAEKEDLGRALFALGKRTGGRPVNEAD